MVEYKLGKNWLNNFIFHLSFLKKLSPNHTHPPISICEFSKPYKLLFLEFESFIKCKILIVKKKSLNSFICHLSLLRNFLPLIHIPSYPFVNFWNPTSYYFLSLSHCMVECKLGKNWLNNFIFHLSWLRKFSLLIHILSYPFMNFFKPMGYYFLS